MHSIYINSSVVALALLGTQAAAQPEPTVQTLEQIISAVPDDGMRTLWRAAAEANQLPPLGTLPLPSSDVAVRRPVRGSGATVTHARAQAREPGEVRVHAAGTGVSFQGRALVRTSRAGRIEVRLGTAQTPVAIDFDLPGTQRMLETESRELNATVINQIRGPALHREVILSDSMGPVLMYVSQGSRKPYRRDFTQLPLLIEQLPPNEAGISQLRIDFDGTEFVMSPGARQPVTFRGNTLEIFVASTHFTAPERVPLAEGNPYHVKVMIFRMD